MIWLPLVIVGTLLFYIFFSLRRRKQPKYFANTEYWVYLNGVKLPTQDDVMNLVFTGRAVGPGEGLLFSDIRLHVGLALREKNPHIFRPDLFEDHIEPTAEILAALAEAKSLAKIRFTSEQPLKDARHVKLLPYMAYAYAKLGGSAVIYDASSEALMTVPQMMAKLKADPQASSAETHVRVVWKRSAFGGHAETRGLVKKGLPELVTEEVEADERVLVTNVLEEAARAIWADLRTPESVEVEGFGDKFRLELGQVLDGKSTVKILRIQPV